MPVLAEHLKVGATYKVGTGYPGTTGKVTAKFDSNPFGFPRGPAVSMMVDGRERVYTNEYTFELVEPPPAAAAAPAAAPAPAPAPAAAVPSADPWYEFDPPRHLRQKPPPLKDVLTEHDINAQETFRKSLTPDEKGALNDYKGAGHTDIRNWMVYSDDPPEENDVWRKHLRVFIKMISKAPKLTREINVYRGIGIDDEATLEMTGKLVWSTSYNPIVAFGFATYGRNGCCMLKINVQPGVRIIAFGDDDDECEIMIIPPYNVSIEDIVPGLKRVKITPKEAPSGGRRRKSRRTRVSRTLRVRKTHRRHI